MILSAKRVIVAAELRRRQARRGVVDELLGSCFAEQLEFALAVLSQSVRRIALRCARRAGKSWGIGVAICALCLMRPNARAIWLGLTQRNVKRFGWEIISKLNIRFRLGLIPNKSELKWIFPNGSTVEFDGADNVKEEAEKYTGAAFDLVVVDECGSFAANLLEFMWNTVFRPTLMDSRGTVIFGGSPRHILKGLFYDGTRGVLSDWAPFRWSSLDNPHMREQILAEIAEMRAANPDVGSTTSYRREILGEWCPDASDFVYGGFSDACLVHEPWKPVQGIEYTHRTGLDLGYNDDSALVHEVWHPGSADLRVVEAVKHPGLSTAQLAEHCKRFQRSYPKTVFIGDPAWKTTLEDLRRKYKIPVRIAKKERKQDAIRDLNGELEGVAWDGGHRRILIHAGACKPLIDEISVLPWHETGRGERVEHPGFANHCTDAMLYAWRDATHWSYSEDQVKETYNERTLRILQERERSRGESRGFM